MEKEKARRGIQSVEVASLLLQVMTRHVRPITLGDLARTAGMSPGKAHPYMVSFMKVGLVSQDATTGMYRLGPMALQLGLAHLNQLDPVKEALPHLGRLADETHLSVAISVWGNLGATIVQLIEPEHPMHVNLRAGTVMSLTDTATGQAFAAFLPPLVVRRYVESSLNRLAGPPSKNFLSPEQFENRLTETRGRGMARAIGHPIPGINAFAAPVFDLSGQVVLVVTVMGPDYSFDAEWGSGVHRALERTAAEISNALGFRGREDASAGNANRLPGL